MLTHLHVSNFTVVDQLDLELDRGLTTITGETGAGKSVLLGALSLALGDRADADKVRSGCKKSEIQATFDISELPFAQNWLNEHDLSIDSSSPNTECLLRRVITAEGRSRAYINGQSVTLPQIRTLGEMLIDIHSQHEHQSLLDIRTHRRLLDEFGGLRPLAKQVKGAFNNWHQKSDALKKLQSLSDEVNARFQLLSYQVDELDQLNVEEGEIDRLEKQLRELSNFETIQRNCQHVVEICSQDDGLQERINHALHLLNELPEKSTMLNSAEGLLKNALIYVQETQSEIEQHLASQEADPQQLAEIEQRLSKIYDIARKHRIPPNDLPALHTQLATELNGLQDNDEKQDVLEKEVEQHLQTYNQLASELSEQRQFAAARLTKAANGKLAQLSMEHAQFSLALHKLEESGKMAKNTLPVSPTPYGNETIEFLISTAPGQAPKPLAKIASGGELSRVSLAIQVVTAQTSKTPTLVFDEVDVGIGGATGDVVGNMLRELGASGQVLCVTHLAQVASKGHHHLLVDKSLSASSATSTIEYLENKAKIAEIARMMGGQYDSKQSLAHAKQMIAKV